MACEKSDCSVQSLSSIENLLDLDAVKLYDKFKPQQHTFINRLKFHRDDVTLLLKKIKSNNPQKILEYVTYENLSQYNYSSPHCFKFHLHHLGRENMVEQFDVTNFEAITLLSSTDRTNLIERYVKLSQLRCRELLELYNQYKVVASLRSGVKITDEITFELITAFNEYAIKLCINFRDYRYYTNTLPPTYNLSETMIDAIGRNLINEKHYD